MSHSSRLHSIGISCFRDRSVGRLYTTLNLSSVNPLVVRDSLQARDRYSHRSTAVTWCAPASIAVIACNPAHDTHTVGSINACVCVFENSTAQHSTAQHSTAQIDVYCWHMHDRCTPKAAQKHILPGQKGGNCMHPPEMLACCMNPKYVALLVQLCVHLSSVQVQAFFQLMRHNSMTHGHTHRRKGRRSM